VFFFKLKPSKFSQIREYKAAISNLRTFAKEKILDRINEIEKEGVVNDDMLSIILAGASN
jgi:hypothetical protein